MKAALDVRVLADPAFAERGIGRYTRALLDALLEAGRDICPIRDLRRPPAPKRGRELFEHALLGRDARRIGADVLHSPSVDFATARAALPYVITVHDLVPLKHPERYLRTGVKHRLRYEAVRRATRVITPSRAVAHDCERLLGTDPARLDVVAEAAAAVFRPVANAADRLARFDLPEEFMLWVGGLDPPDPRKGIWQLAAVAAQRDGLPLVLAGRLSPEASSLASPARVLLIGRPSDEELAALYSAAVAVVIPSEEEGFGLPAVEALACGTPVAAFAIDAMTELRATHPGIALVEPGAYEALLREAESLAGQRATPPARTWTDVAAETWRAYELAVSSP